MDHNREEGPFQNRPFGSFQGPFHGPLQGHFHGTTQVIPTQPADGASQSHDGHGQDPRIPDHTQPVPRRGGTKATSRRRPLYEIRPTKDMGLGLFASQNISRGTRILADTAIFTLTKRSTADKNATEQHVTNFCDQLIEQGLFDQKLTQMEGLSPNDRIASHPDIQNACRRFITDLAQRMGLSPAGIEDNVARFARLFSILLVNRTSQMGDVLGVDTLCAIFPINARINHSCDPNAYRQVNAKLKQLTVHALQDIKAGEQITVTYVSLLAESPPEKLKRHENLRTTFVICRCRVCRGSTNTDPLLRELYLKYWGAYLLIHPAGPYGRTLDVESNVIKVAADKREAVEFLTRAVEITKHPLINMQNEKVTFMYTLLALLLAKLGETQLSVEYAGKAVQLLITIGGVDGNSVGLADEQFLFFLDVHNRRHLIRDFDDHVRWRVRGQSTLF